MKKLNFLLVISIICLICSGIFKLNHRVITSNSSTQKSNSEVNLNSTKEKVTEDNKIKKLFEIKKDVVKKENNVTSIAMKNGFYKLNDSYYFFDELGISQTGFIKYEDKIYYLSEQDGLATGFKIINDKTYYFNNEGILQTGLIEIDNKNYYFDEFGVMQIGFINVNNKIRYFSENGELFGFINVDNNVYYVDESNGLLTKLQTIKDNEYYFDEDGVMQTGFVNDENNTYYFNESGIREKGWINIENNKYYLNDTTLLTGLNNIDGNNYYFNEFGILETGLITIDNDLYYFNDDGVMFIGLLKLENKIYYFDNDGKNKIGFIEINNNKYYINNEQEYLIGLNKIENNTYYFNEEGIMQTGFQAINNNTYYFDEFGKMITNEIIIDDKKYYFNSEGILEKEENIKEENEVQDTVKGKTFYKDDGSILATNAKKIIDVSKFQGNIDWNLVKNSDVDGAILRLGFGSYSLDSKFIDNLNAVKSLNIPYGIYLYSYAVNGSEALSEANFVVNSIYKYNINPSLGIYYDIESNDITRHLTNLDYSVIIPTFLNKVRETNYKVNVYTYKALANEKLYTENLKREITWIAQYNNECTWDGFYEGWQYTSTGKVNGINGNVDISIFGEFKK